MTAAVWLATHAWVLLVLVFEVFVAVSIVGNWLAGREGGDGQ